MFQFDNIMPGKYKGRNMLWLS